MPSSKHPRTGKLFKYDVSLRPSDMAEFVAIIRSEIASSGIPIFDPTCADRQKNDNIESLQVCTFGHVGDGNMHLNILFRSLPPSRIASLKKILDEIIFREVASRRGSISAEHGVGQDKASVLFPNSSRNLNGAMFTKNHTLVRSAAELAVMYSVKMALDPRGIMNPGKVIPLLPEALKEPSKQ